MSIKYINTGSSANKGDGDTLRTAFNKINSNFEFVDKQSGLFPSGLYNGTWTFALSSTGTVTLNGQPFASSGGTTDYNNLTNKPALFSGSYTDLSNKPTIPTSFSSLVNGSQTASLGSTGILTLPSSNYLESTDTNLKVGAQGTVTIRSNAASNLTTKSWTFGTDGTLTFPNTTQQTTAYLGTATTSKVGGIKVGTNLEISEDGTLTATTQSNQQLYTTSSVAFQSIALPGAGGDQHWESVTLLLHGNNFQDYSSHPQIVSQTGVTIDNSVQKFGDGSYAFNSTDQLSEPNLVANFERQNFTVEGWFYFNSNNVGYQPLMANAGSADYQGWMLFVNTDNTINLFASRVNGSWNYQYGTGYTPPTGEWIHIAVDRVVDLVLGDSLNIYVNGVSVASGSCENWTSPTNAFYLGYYPWYLGTTPQTFSGNIDEVRITIGVARYQGSTFSVQTAPYPAFGYSPFTGQIVFGDNTIQTTAYTGNYTDLVGIPTIPTDIADLTDTSGLLNGGNATTSLITNNGYSLSIDTTGTLTFPDGTTSTGNVVFANSSSYKIKTISPFEGSPSSVVSTYEFGVASMTIPGNGIINNEGFEGAWALDGANGQLTFPNNSRISYGLNNAGLTEDDLRIQAINTGNVVVSANGEDWIFGTDGKLTLPSDVSAIVGNDLSIKTESNISITIKTPGSGYGISGGAFATTGGSGTGMIVQVFSPGGSLVAVSINNPGSGYLDGDVINVLGGSGTVVFHKIQSTWTFGTDGDLTLPGNIVSNNQAIKFSSTTTDHTTYTVTANMFKFGNDSNPTATWDILSDNYSTGFTNTRLIVPTSTANTNTYISFTSPSNTTALQNSDLINQMPGGRPGFNVISSNAINLVTNPDSGFHGTGVGHSWTFDNAGSLTLPQGSAINETAGVSTNIVVNGHSWAFDVNGNLTIPGEIKSAAGIGNVVIEANTGTLKTWTFGGNGSLTFPDTTVQATAYREPDVTNQFYIDPFAGTNYTPTGSILKPFRTISAAQAEIEARITAGSLVPGELNPIFIVLTGSITENVTLTRGHIFLTALNGSIHTPIYLYGQITIDGSATGTGAIDANHFAITGLTIVGPNQGACIYFTGSNAQRLMVQSIWLTARGSQTGTTPFVDAGGYGIYSDNSGVRSTDGKHSPIHGSDIKISHNGTGDVYCFRFSNGSTGEFANVETSGATQVGAVGTGSLLAFSNSTLDANGDTILEAYGTGSLSVNNCIMSNANTGVAYGIWLHSLGGNAIIINTIISVVSSNSASRMIKGHATDPTGVFYNNIMVGKSTTYPYPDLNKKVDNTVILTALTGAAGLSSVAP